MSDFLTHLAARSLDLPSPVQPRPASLFEPQRPLDGAVAEPVLQEAEESGVPTPRPHPFSRPFPPSEGERFDPPEDLPRRASEDGESARRASLPEPAALPSPESSAPPPRRPEPTRTGLPPSPGARPEAAAAPTAERGGAIRIEQVTLPPVVLAPAFPALMAPPPAVPHPLPKDGTAAGVGPTIGAREAAGAGFHPSPRPAATTPPPAPPLPRTDIRPAAGVERVAVERVERTLRDVAVPLPAARVSPGDVTVPQPAVRIPPEDIGLLVPRSEPAFPAAPPPLATGGGAAPTIEVTIGRIEVRATPASPASSPARRRASGPPAMSLQDYLRQRDGRGGR